MLYGQLGHSLFYNHIPMQFISFLPSIATGHMSFPNVPDETGAEQMNLYYVKRAQVTNIRGRLFLWDVFLMTDTSDLTQILFCHNFDC